MQLLDINSNKIDIKKYSAVTDNSKNVKPGGIFVAVHGIMHDGHDYIDEALKRGAALIIIDKTKVNLKTTIANTSVMIADDSRLMLSYIASQIYEKPENIVAITGTNGKTSVAYFFQQLLSMLNVKAASIGTLGVISNNKTIINLDLTSPGAVQMHEILQDIKDQEINYVALEASSHGLIQHRTEYIPFKGAAFTSFSREHLDYHKNMESYLQAKLYLFDHLLDKESFALINSEMDVAERIIKVCESKGIKALTYGHGGNFLDIKSIKYSNDNSFDVEFLFDGQIYQFSCNFFGRFQVYNILCTVGILVSLGFDIKKLLPLLEKLSNIPGRMQRVLMSNVYVDYSHTPDAISNALESMKEFIRYRNKKGKIIIVFGCGGDRDKGKRFEMGKIANELADIVVVTDDNPRSEDPSEIRKAVMKGCSSAIEISDREQAIKYAIQHSKPEDLILIAGKGHEKFQIVGKQKFEFDDTEIAKKYLFS